MVLVAIFGCTFFATVVMRGVLHLNSCYIQGSTRDGKVAEAVSDMMWTVMRPRVIYEDGVFGELGCGYRYIEYLDLSSKEEPVVIGEEIMLLDQFAGEGHEFLD